MLNPRHSEVQGKVNSEFLAFTSSAEWFRQELWEFSVPRNSRNPSEQKTICFVNSVFRLHYFLSEIPDPTVNVESRPLPVMHDFGHDGWLNLVLFIYYIKSAGYAISLKLSSSRNGGQAVRSGKSGGTDRPSRYKSHMLGHFTPAKLGRTPCRASPPW